MRAQTEMQEVSSEYEEKLPYLEWDSTETSCPEKLWRFLCWCSKPTWMCCCVTCSKWTCFGRGLGLGLQMSLPIPGILWFCDPYRSFSGSGSRRFKATRGVGFWPSLSTGRTGEIISTKTKAVDIAFSKNGHQEPTSQAFADLSWTSLIITRQCSASTNSRIHCPSGLLVKPEEKWMEKGGVTLLQSPPISQCKPPPFPAAPYTCTTLNPPVQETPLQGSAQGNQITALAFQRDEIRNHFYGRAMHQSS